jgi:RimJ/RimL family protein N-acetyltransferase
VDVILRDGTRVLLRPIRPEDDHALVDAFNRMSPQTVYQRFFAAIPELTDDMAHHLSHLDGANRLALVAEIDSEVAAVGRYERTTDPDVVELGLVVVDKWQNRGLGRILLRATVEEGTRHGIQRFRAEVLSENPRMLHLLAEVMEIREMHSQSGVTTLLLEPKAAAAKIDS